MCQPYLSNGTGLFHYPFSVLLATMPTQMTQDSFKKQKTVEDVRNSFLHVSLFARLVVLANLSVYHPP